VPVKKLIITVLVLSGLFVAADYGAAAFAEYQISTRMRAELRLIDDPAVRIYGFPFLYQEAIGDYHNIEVKSTGLTVGQLHNVEIHANLFDVRTRLSKLATGESTAVRVDKVVGKVKIRATAEPNKPDELVEPAQRPVTTTTKAAEKDRTVAQIKLVGTTDVAGTATEVRVFGTVSLINGQVVVSPRKLELKPDGMDTISLPEPVQRSVMAAFAMKLDPGQLPLTVAPTAISVESGTLVVEGEATDIVISGNGVTQPSR
jgi:hypothetical protein